MVKLILICGDCTKIMPLLPKKSIDLVLTDPPYGISYQSNARKIKFDKIQNDDCLDWVNSFLVNCRNITKEKSILFCFTRWDVYPFFFNEISKYFNVKNCLIIKKRGMGSGDLSNFANNYEMCLFAIKGDIKLKEIKEYKVSDNTLKNKRYKGDGYLKRFPALIDFINVSPFNLNLIHPNEKTIEIISFLMKISSDKSDWVLDCFAGSGTNLKACLELQRNGISIEISEKYCNIIKERLNWGSSLNPNLEFIYLTEEEVLNNPEMLTKHLTVD